MPTILRKMPFFDVPAKVDFGRNTAVIATNQMFVWVSLADSSVETLVGDSPYFPAIIDTGFNNTVLLQQVHLTEWAKLDSGDLLRISTLTAYGQNLPIYSVNVWIRPNRVGKFEVDENATPFCMPLFPGVAICPSSVGKPRLPLIGLRALELADVQIMFQWSNRSFSLRTSTWWERLGDRFH